MILGLNPNWRIRSDPLQWIVEQRIPGAKAARHKWKARAFCGTLDHAVVWAGRRRVMELPGEYGLDALPPLRAALDAIVNEVRAALAQAQSLVAIRHDQSCQPVPDFGKPDATGRSSGKRTGRAARAHRPPKGEPWIWLTRELLISPAWRAHSTNTGRILDFLLVEHMNHAGTENGRLMATHEQLRGYGLNANSIRDAIDEAEFLGLIRSERGGRWAGTNRPSTYRLTFLPDWEGSPPTNEWKRRTNSQIEGWKAERKSLRAGHRKRKATLKLQSTEGMNCRVRLAR